MLITADTTGDDSSDDSSDGFSGRAIAGIVIGVIVGLFIGALLVVGIVYFIKSRPGTTPKYTTQAEYVMYRLQRSIIMTA